jgi:hypothetical protein
MKNWCGALSPLGRERSTESPCDTVIVGLHVGIPVGEQVPEIRVEFHPPVQPSRVRFLVTACTDSGKAPRKFPGPANIELARRIENVKLRRIFNAVI